MKSIQISIAAIVLGIAFSANTCTNKDANTTAGNPSQLPGKWVLTSVQGEPVNMPDGSEKPFLTIDSLAQNANGFAGCNRIFGALALHGDSLSFAGMAGTKMFCQETQQVEDQFLNALAGTRTYVLRDGKLVLLGDKELAILERSR